MQTNNQEEPYSTSYVRIAWIPRIVGKTDLFQKDLDSPDHTHVPTLGGERMIFILQDNSAHSPDIYFCPILPGRVILLPFQC